MEKPVENFKPFSREDAENKLQEITRAYQNVNSEFDEEILPEDSYHEKIQDLDNQRDLVLKYYPELRDVLNTDI